MDANQKTIRIAGFAGLAPRLKTTGYNASFRFGNLSWSLIMKEFECPETKTLDYSLSFEVLGTTTLTVDHTSIKVKISLLNQRNENQSIIRKFTLDGTAASAKFIWSWPHFISKLDLLDQTRGYLKDNRLLITVCLDPEVPFLEFGRLPHKMVQYLNEVNAAKPAFFEALRNLDQLPECKFNAVMALGTILLFLKSKRIRDMEGSYVELRQLWNHLQIFGLDCGWLKPSYERALSFRDYALLSNKAKRLKANHAAEGDEAAQYFHGRDLDRVVGYNVL